MPRCIPFGLAAITFAIYFSAMPANANEQIEYGQYLSGECTACHRAGDNQTIPPIFGWPVEAFVAVMESYKRGERTNKAMISVAKSLDTDQIKALAAYFATVKAGQ